jgi:hypothetical protein
MRVVYVEDTEDHFKDIRWALEHRKSTLAEPIIPVHAPTPEDLKPEVLRSADVVLADVYFEEKGEQRSRLKDIIDTVRRFEEAEARAGRTLRIPVIAYTGRGTLAECLQFRDELFDIWNKHTADPEYVAWRMEELATALARLRPDRFLQQVVRTCPATSPIAQHIPLMLQRYNERWNEANQIDQTGDVVEAILAERDMLEALGELWRTMATWEMLGRAVSRRMRGHARHVYNVYWLGYALLNDPILSEGLGHCWKTATRGSTRREVVNESPIVAMNLVWFYAALFHDTAYCVEELSNVTHTVSQLLKVFERRASVNVNSTLKLSRIKKEVRKLLANNLDTNTAKEVTRIVDASLSEGRPDHGIIAALQMNDLAHGKPDEAYVNLAAEAVALHNALGKYAGPPAIAWNRQPIACLLLVADQLQTWDRERGDAIARDHLSDMAERAELGGFQVRRDNDQTLVSLLVRYLSPAHLRLSPSGFARETQRLERILREKPQQALSKIARDDWPFQLRVAPYLDTTSLIVDLTFPRPARP